MAINEKLTNRVREALAHMPKVAEKKMFSGIAFMVNGKMCVTVRDERIMCRIDPSIHDELLEKKDCRTMVMNGREYKGFMLVNEDAIKNKKEFDYWIGLALEFNKKAKAAKKKK